MRRAERERLLLRWAHSPLALRRSAFHAFRKLLTFLAYADPGRRAVAEPAPRTIGYGPTTAASRPSLDRRSARSSSTDAPGDAGRADHPRRRRRSSSDRAPAAASWPPSWRSAGRSVLVLEAGPFVDEATMPRDELDAYGRLYLNHGLLSTWDGVDQHAGRLGGRRRDARQLDDLHRRPGRGPRGMGARPRPRGRRRRRVGRRRRGHRGARSVSRPPTVIPPKDDADPPRRRRASAGMPAPIRRNAADCGDCGRVPVRLPRAGRSSRGSGPTSPRPPGTAPVVDRVAGHRSCSSRAAGVAGVEGKLLVTDPRPGCRSSAAASDRDRGAAIRRLVATAPQVVLAAGRPAEPGDPPGVAAPRIRRSAATCGSIRCRSSAALMDEPVDMWRGTMQAVRSLEFATRRAGTGGATSSSPRPAIRACSPWPCPGTAPPTTPT